MNIRNQADYDKALDTIEILLEKGINELTGEEKEHLNAILVAIEGYRRKLEHHPAVYYIP